MKQILDQITTTCFQIRFEEGKKKKKKKKTHQHAWRQAISSVASAASFLITYVSSGKHCSSLMVFISNRSIAVAV